MWIEIVDNNGKTIGAVNTDACDLIKMTQDGPEASALMRNANGSGEVYLTKISYLRLIDNMTAEQANTLADVQADAAKPRLVSL